MLERRIDDREFLDLYRKAVQSNYVDLAKGALTPQGGTMSAILSNIMLHELDHWIREEYGKGSKGSGNTSKPNKKRYRVYYVRYADEFLIGVNGTYDQTEKVRTGVSKYLEKELNLELNMERTQITNAGKGRAKYLGAEISIKSHDQKRTVRRTSTTQETRRRVTNRKIRLLAPIGRIAKRLADQDMCEIQN